MSDRSQDRGSRLFLIAALTLMVAALGWFSWQRMNAEPAAPVPNQVAPAGAPAAEEPQQAPPAAEEPAARGEILSG